jgi:hypothetical protein
MDCPLTAFLRIAYACCIKELDYFYKPLARIGILLFLIALYSFLQIQLYGYNSLHASAFFFGHKRSFCCRDTIINCEGLKG